MRMVGGTAASGHENESAARLALHTDAWRWAVGLTGRADVAGEIADGAIASTVRSAGTTELSVAYLRQSVVNACSSWHRSVARERAFVDATPAGGQARSTFTSGAAGLGDCAVAVLDALGAMPFGQRAAVVLRFWAGWTDADIAEVLSATAADVRALAHRGLAALRPACAPAHPLRAPTDGDALRDLTSSLDELARSASGSTSR